jgi:molecular chaperone GrpE
MQQFIAKYRSASDDFEQARARLRKEVTKDVERGRRSLIVSFLEVLDNLDRALAAAAGDRGADPFVQGVSLVRQQFLSTLEGLGVRRLEPVGQPFDPARHEAVSSVAASPDMPAGTVAGIVRPGYLIGDEVLRPAQVAVVG